MSESPLETEVELDFFSPCPGCGEIGYTIRVWHGGIQMMECGNNDCRVNEYEPRVVDEDG